MAIINAVTHFGDLAIVLPLALAAMLWFAYIRAGRLIFYWATSLATCLLTTIILKMHFLSCPSSFLDLRSPSGHSSVSILVYGALGTIGSQALSGTRRIAAVGGAATLIVLIAVSRWILGAHTVLEILVGLAIGGVSLLPFLYAYRHTPTPKIAPLPLLAVLAILPFALLIESPDTEKILGRAAARLQEIVPTCEGRPIAPDELAQ